MAQCDKRGVGRAASAAAGKNAAPAARCAAAVAGWFCFCSRGWRTGGARMHDVAACREQGGVAAALRCCVDAQVASNGRIALLLMNGSVSQPVNTKKSRPGGGAAPPGQPPRACTQVFGIPLQPCAGSALSTNSPRGRAFYAGGSVHRASSNGRKCMCVRGCGDGGGYALPAGSDPPPREVPPVAAGRGAAARQGPADWRACRTPVLQRAPGRSCRRALTAGRRRQAGARPPQ